MSEVKAYENPILPRHERIAAIGYNYDNQDLTGILSCNLCGSDQWTILSHFDRYGFPAQATVCNKCGLTMLNPRMTAYSYKNFYDKIYRPLVSAYHGRRIDAQTIQEEQKVFAAEAARFVFPFLKNKKGGFMLDVGGSTGVIAAHFVNEFSVKATVLDPASDEISIAKSLGIETITALVEDWQPGTRRYDIVSLFKTIDHLLDINATLYKLRKIIKDDGIFILDIVDFRAAYLRMWSVEAGVKIDHPYSLTQEVMEAFLKRNGFSILRKSYNADHLHVSFICHPSISIKDYLPSKAWIESFLSEIRFIQNAPVSLK